MFARRSIFIFLHCNWARVIYISDRIDKHNTNFWLKIIYFFDDVERKFSILTIRKAVFSLPFLLALLFFLAFFSRLSFLLLRNLVPFSPLLCAKTISFRFSRSSWLTDRVRTVLFLKAQERSIVPSVVRGYFFQEAFRLSNDLPRLLFRRRVAHE